MSKQVLDVLIFDSEQYIPVPKFVINWIEKVPEELNTHEVLPEEIINFLDPNKINEYQKRNSKVLSTIFVTSGSWENDRALFISCYVSNYFESIKELNNYFSSNDITMGKELNYLNY